MTLMIERFSAAGDFFYMLSSCCFFDTLSLQNFRTGYSYSNFGSAPPHSGEELGWTLLPTENARGGVLEGAPPQNGFQV